MREILFRGKRESDRKWIYGLYSDDYVHETDFPCIMPLRAERNDHDWEVIRETVGQYTGLEDTNGKKIFEGDIFECYVDYDDSFGYSQTLSFLAVVVWDEKHFCWGMKVNDEIQDFSDWTWENSVLVGNIHDNPELLKGE